MRNPEYVLNSLIEHSKDANYKYERLYRQLYNQEMYLRAYQNIYAKEGNMTKGVDGKTIDGMSLKRIDKIINSLKDESYQPNPAKRVYIPKKNGKKRPLGIPSFEDKLLQEVIRMILEAIYENSFEETSHGFRPNRSCHTALIEVQNTFTAAKWFIEGDIKGCFDCIDHNKLIEILGERIKDDKFLRLLRKFLKAGYMEDWQYNKTYSGTPQGSIISPILANIYLDKLDKYMKDYIEKFNKGKRRDRNPIYRKNETQLAKVRKLYKNADNETDKRELLNDIKRLEQERLNLSPTLAITENYKRLTYVRYADDWLCGIIGSKEDCKNIKRDISVFLKNVLRLELSDEKTLITNAKDRAHFLGFDIRVRNSNQTRRDNMGRLNRSYTAKVVLEIPKDKIRQKLLEYGALEVKFVDGKEVWKPKHRNYLKNNDDLEILETYNSEIRGLYNYYCIANNSSHLNNFYYVMKYSMLKTFAWKYNTRKSKIIKKYRIGKDFGVKYTDRKGKEIARLFYNEGFKRKKEGVKHLHDDEFTGVIFKGSNSLIQRLTAGECEVCGKKTDDIEIHHVRKLKNLNDKDFWNWFMIARNRKTLALCHDCHVKLHNGRLD